MDKTTDVSIVVPVFNSVATLEALFLRTKVVLEGMNLSFEMLFVDDGSRDHSWQVINALKAQYGDQVRGFRLARNSGQQAATFCGLQHAAGNWIVTIDDDLQSPPEEIPKLWAAAHRQEADVVYGVSSSRRHGLLHRLGAKVFRLLLRQTALDFPNGSSFRLIRGDLTSKLPQSPWPWSYVDPVLAWLTSEWVAVEVRQDWRQNGKSGYSFFALVGIALNILVIYSTLPLQIMIWLGSFSAMVSLGLGTFYFVQKLTVGAQLGFSAIIVTITFVSGVVLMSLGILGIYIAKIYVMVFGQPAYTVKWKI